METQARTIITFPLPQHLSPERLRREVRQHFPFNNNNGSKYFGFRFSPPSGVKRISVDFAKSNQATAAGICELLSMLDWLKSEIQFPITIRGKAGLANFGLDQQFNPTEKSIAAFPLPPRRITIPPFHLVDTDDGKMHRNALKRTARKLADDLAGAMPGIDDEILAKSALEFFREGLLNAYEHGFALSQTGGSVWVAASRLPANVSMDSCWEQWQRRFSTNTNSVLELAIVDNGASVPEMLGDVYSGLKDAKDRDFSTEFHDAILEYALSPFGTRKRWTDHASDTIRQGYRGLYRILHHSEALAGQTLLRSGLGLYGYGYTGSDPISVRASDLSGMSYNATSALPGTTLCMRVILPLRQRSPHRRLAPAEPLPESKLRFQLAPSRLWPAASWSLDEYVSYFNRGMKEDFKQHERVPASNLHMTGIIHPGSRVIGSPETSARELWNAAALMMAENTQPDFIPVHFFFDVPPDDDSLAHETFWSICTEKLFEVPAIYGLQSPSDGQLYWFVFIPNQKRESLQLSHERELYAERPEKWWALLEGTYRRIVTIDQSVGHARLRLHLPQTLPMTIQAEALSFLVRRLAQTRSAAWYWQAGDNEKTLVCTRSGKLVKHYVTAFALCLNETVVEMIVVSLLEDHIRQMIDAGHDRIHMVPDKSSGASYILAKRLRSQLSCREKVVVTHIEQLPRTKKVGEGILAFTDAIHTSERISRRIEGQSQNGLRPESVFACLDLRQPDAVWPSHLPPLVTLIRWPLPLPLPRTDELTADHTMVTIDALTHEMLPAGETPKKLPSHSYYDDLRWRNPCHHFPQPELLSRLQVMHEQVTFPKNVLPYGLQHIDERLHVARFQMSKALEDQNFRNQVGRWLAAVIGSLIPHDDDRDVVFFCRDDCGVAKYQNFLAAEALRSLQDIGRPLKGTLWVAPLPAARKGMRRLLSHHPSTRIQGATPISPERRGQTQLSLQQSSVRNGYVAMFIDSASASGRTIRDFLLPMAEIGLQPRPGMLAICPLISRLPAMEEKVLLRTHHLSTGWGDLRPNDVSTPEQLPLHFAALLQLRTPGYASAALMPGLVTLRNVLARVDESWHEDMQKWKSGVERRLDYVNAGATQVETCPLYVGSADRDIMVSEEALLIRQLLTLHQEGLPVISPLVERLRTGTIVNPDYSLLAVLALEPELLDDDVLHGSFLDDIAALALHALDDAAPPLRSCALWVLWFLVEPFAHYQAEITTRCTLDHDLRGQWLSLIYALRPINRSRITQVAKDAVGKLYQEHRGRAEEFRRDLSRCGNVLALWNEAVVSKHPRSAEEARECVRAFLCEARTRHDEIGFPVWNQITRDVKQDSPGSSPTPVIASSHWDKAEEFLKKQIFHVLTALRILNGSGKQENPYCAMVLARDAFQHARIANNPTTRETEWTKVRANTLAWSVEWLFADNPVRVVGIGDIPPLEGIIDRMLPEVVQEPVGMLLHILTVKLEERFAIELDLDHRMKKKNGQRRLTAPLTISARMLIREFWKEADRLALVWDNRIYTLRRVFSLIAENILRHGDSSYPCTVTVRLREEGGESMIDLAISSVAKASKTPGDGNGLGQIARFAEDVGGEFSYSLDGQIFRNVIKMPVDLLKLGGEPNVH